MGERGRRGLRSLLLGIAGLAAGFAIASLWPRAELDGPPLGAPVSDTVERLLDLELALNEEREERALLERRVAVLSERLDALGVPAEAPGLQVSRAAEGPDEAAGADAAADAGDAGESPPSRRAFGRGGFAAADPRERVQRLIDAGLPSERAEWISRREAELQMQALQEQYDARRENRPVEMDAVQGAQRLRAEIGDAEYELYLEAIGMPTSVGVRNVIASSPAEAAGLQPGDEILGYAGQRVFDMRELNRLTFEGQAGQPVIVDVVRDGQRVQLVLPRGPLGISGGGRFRGRP